MTDAKRPPRRKKAAPPDAASPAAPRPRAASTRAKPAPRSDGPRARAPRSSSAPPAPSGPAPVAPRPRAAPSPRRPGGSAVVGWLAAGAALLAVVASGAVFAWASSTGPGPGKDVEVDWPAGLDDARAVAELERLGLIASPTLFGLYLRVSGGAASLAPGPHLVKDDLSPRKLLSRLQRSALGERARVTLPEGVHRFEIARRLQAAGVCGARAFLAATTDAAALAKLGVAGDSAEGRLFPATYDLALDAEPASVVARLVEEHAHRMDKLLRQYAAGAESVRATLGWGAGEIVTLASVVEREAAVDDERPLVASVFLNRLRDPAFHPRRLESDATTAYGCVALAATIPSCRAYAGRVTPEMNRDDANPYSTYRHEGLPPGPIANPGERSLAAVLAPADTRYFFFVARGERRHTFTETLAQHEDAIRRARP